LFQHRLRASTTSPRISRTPEIRKFRSIIFPPTRYSAGFQNLT
jgi:hypothetical protein